MLFKIRRLILGGTWLKMKTFNSNGQYWCRPSNPDFVEKIAESNIIKKETYGWSFFMAQYI